MAINSDIRDHAYDFFAEEAVELLQSLEAELLTLGQDHSTPKIHSLMRTAHSLKGGAASVGLEPIAALAHRLENIFKALYSDTLEIDTTLESQLLQAYDCVRSPLTEQFMTGQFDAEQALATAEPVLTQIEARMGEALTATENYIPTSSELGVDMVASILEVDVAEGLMRLTSVLGAPEDYEVAGELRAQVEVFAGFAELLNLPELGAIAELTQQALDNHPDQAIEIGQIAVDDFSRVRQTTLDHKRWGQDELPAAELMPSPNLIALADGPTADRPTADVTQDPTASNNDFADTPTTDFNQDPTVSHSYLATDQYFHSDSDADPTADRSAAASQSAKTRDQESATQDMAASLSQLVDMFEGSFDFAPFDTSESALFEPLPSEPMTPEAIALNADVELLATASADPANPAFTDGASAHPEFTDPEFTNPELTDPETTNPEFTNPKFTTEATNPELTTEATNPEPAPPLPRSPAPPPLSTVTPRPAATVKPDRLDAAIPEPQPNEAVTAAFDLADTHSAAIANPDQAPFTSAQNGQSANGRTVSRQVDSTSASREQLPQARRSSQRSIVSSLTVRVESERLEQMSNRVGELVINRDGVAMQNEQLQGTLRGLLKQFDQFREHIDRLRDVATAMPTTSESAWSNEPRLSTSQPPASGEGPNRLPRSFKKDADPSLWLAEFDALEMDRYGSLHLQLQEIFEEVMQLEEKVNDITLFTHQSEQKLNQQQQMLIQLRDDLTWARMVPVGEVFNRFPRMLRDLSITHAKPVDLKLQGAEVLIEKAILEKLFEPLVHLLRNAFDHGIESPHARQQQGKSDSGHIELRAYHQGNQTIIEVADDGRGISLDRIRDRALEQGLLTADQVAAMSPAQLYELLFESGFSTTQKVSELSGRGVGLDVVRAQLKTIRGRVTVSSTLGQGTLFTLRLPLTLTIRKLITFLSGSVALALSMEGVQEILTPQAHQLRQIGTRRFLQWEEHSIPIYPLTELLDYRCLLPEAAPSQLRANASPLPRNWGSPVFILRRQQQLCAVEVDRVITEQERVIKPLGTAIAPPAYIYGCTILGDGSLIPVIDGVALTDLIPQAPIPHPNEVTDAVELPPEAIPESANASPPTIQSVQALQAPTLLVVDDSATLRRTISISLERAGFRVLQAKDGKEAIDQLLQNASVKLIVCDIEMPNMNGFEFLSHRRQHEAMADIPTVMLTSRNNDKHRWLAKQLGAAGYFTKPYLEQEFIETLASLIET